MKKVIRIGSGSGAFIDSIIGPSQLIKKGNIQYMMLDYMAELTTSMFSKAKKEDPESGFALEFTDWIWKGNVRHIAERGIKVITNAGGLNPQACRRVMEKYASSAGVSLKIAVIEGDDIMNRMPVLTGQGVKEMFSDMPLPKISMITSANAYLGAKPIAEALKKGADVVITGRVTDSALVLGPLMYEFGWTDHDYDLLAAGSLAGHIIECGPHATGALFTDWKKIKDWAHIGYPIVEFDEDGSFVVTKPENTGGICTIGTISEQMLYEIGNPQTYFLPDVTCDFSNVRLEQVAKDRVRVSGAKGFPPTSTYKVCSTFQDGFRATGILPIVGIDAPEKAKCQAEAILERIKEIIQENNFSPFRSVHYEILGTEATYGAHSRVRDTREVILKITVEHENRQPLDFFMREVRSPIITMMPGNTGWLPGQPAISPVVKVFSFLVKKNEINVFCDFEGKRWQIPIATEGAFDPQMISPHIAPTVSSSGKMVKVPLVSLAWARSGDKGDSYNIGVIARKPEYLPYIWASIDESAVKEFLAHEFAGAANPHVERYFVPGINAMNILCLQSLGGGQTATPRLDALAKGKAQQLLEFQVSVPESLAREL